MGDILDKKHNLIGYVGNAVNVYPIWGSKGLIIN